MSLRAHTGPGLSASGASSTPMGDLHTPTHPYMRSEMKLLSHARLSINTLATVGVNALCASTNPPQKSLVLCSKTQSYGDH